MEMMSFNDVCQPRGDLQPILIYFARNIFLDYAHDPLSHARHLLLNLQFYQSGFLWTTVAISHIKFNLERLDHNSKPISNFHPFLNSTNKNGDKFIISADSTDCIDGRYSMVITADTNAMNLENRR